MNEFKSCSKKKQNTNARDEQVKIVEQCFNEANIEIDKSTTTISSNLDKYADEKLMQYSEKLEKCGNDFTSLPCIRSVTLEVKTDQGKAVEDIRNELKKGVDNIKALFLKVPIDCVFKPLVQLNKIFAENLYEAVKCEYQLQIDSN